MSAEVYIQHRVIQAVALARDHLFLSLSHNIPQYNHTASQNEKHGPGHRKNDPANCCRQEIEEGSQNENRFLV